LQNWITSIRITTIF